MFSKIGNFLYRVVHASGRLFDLTVHLGPFQASLWVGREDPDAVGFGVDVRAGYYPGYPSLGVEVEVGVIVVQFYLTKPDSD